MDGMDNVNRAVRADWNRPANRNRKAITSVMRVDAGFRLSPE